MKAKLNVLVVALLSVFSGSVRGNPATDQTSSQQAAAGDQDAPIQEQKGAKRPNKKPDKKPDQKPDKKPDAPPEKPNPNPPAGDELGGVRVVARTGTVKSVTGDSITIEGAHGEQWTFTVDSKTTMTVAGAAAKAGTGKGDKSTAGRGSSGTKGSGAKVTDVVKTGDKVTVKSMETADTKRAAAVRVTRGGA